MNQKEERQAMFLVLGILGILLLLNLVLTITIGIDNDRCENIAKENKQLKEDKKSMAERLVELEDITNEYIGLREELCNIGFDEFCDCDPCMSMKAYTCSPSGEWNCKDWKGKKVCDVRVCDYMPATTFTTMSVRSMPEEDDINWNT
jgi:hypothetical protein